MEDVPPVVKKALAKLEASLDAKQPYEGHEMFKTAFHRLRARQQLEHSYTLAQQGALLQLKFGQVNCATELGCMLADAYTTDATPADEGSVLRILSLIDAFTTEGDSPDAEPPIGSATKIVSATLKWLSKVHGEGFAPAVHNAFAAYITRCLGWRGLGIATPHYALCSDVGAFVVAVAEGIKHGQAYEEDLFVTRAALSLAAARQQPGQLDGIRRAQEFLLEYEKQMDRPLDTPLINFLRMFLEALTLRSVPLVEVLLREYATALKRDPGLEQLVGKCRETYVLLPANSGGMPFGDLFRSLLAPA